VCHYLVGRPLGIGFRGFGLRDTDHPEVYPPGLRQVMSVLLMWVALTEPTSRRAASRFGLAAMYAAGETATTVCTVGAAGAAAAAHASWGLGTLWVVAVFCAASSAVVAVIPKGTTGRLAAHCADEEDAPAPSAPATVPQHGRGVVAFDPDALKLYPKWLISALRTHALCSPMHQRLRREPHREPAGHQPHAPRHPAMACPTRR
jgi:hypothetical protein